MTLLITVFAACVTTVLWYKKAPDDSMRLGFLCLMYWGASLMWMCDAIFEYKEMGAEFFTPEVSDMINDGFLGLSVVALGMIIWLAYLIIKDPKGIVKKMLTR
ncbi:MAG: hypothetical protein IJ661_02070 [Lachnospiraceae bacterium]|nr:hypothetical protein [Lachnospiraceae bacterium]